MSRPNLPECRSGLRLIGHAFVSDYRCMSADGPRLTRSL